jgi:hypothetical protein
VNKLRAAVGSTPHELQDKENRFCLSWTWCCLGRSWRSTAVMDMVLHGKKLALNIFELCSCLMNLEANVRILRRQSFRAANAHHHDVSPRVIIMCRSCRSQPCQKNPALKQEDKELFVSSAFQVIQEATREPAC